MAPLSSSEFPPATPVLWRGVDRTRKVRRVARVKAQHWYQARALAAQELGVLVEDVDVVKLEDPGRRKGAA